MHGFEAQVTSWPMPALCLCEADSFLPFFKLVPGVGFLALGWVCAADLSVLTEGLPVSCWKCSSWAGMR